MAASAARSSSMGSVGGRPYMRRDRSVLARIPLPAEASWSSAWTVEPHITSTTGARREDVRCVLSNVALHRPGEFRNCGGCAAAHIWIARR